MATQEIHFGSLTLRPGRQLLANGAPVALGRKPLDILSVLANAKGELVTKSELMDAVWPGLVVEENAIQAHMVVLRKALGIEAERLKTVRGFGYRLDVPLAARAQSVIARANEEQPSVAVLPFSNLTGDPANDYLADGMAEELICTLSRGSELRVPARTSVFAYKGRDDDIRRIARELGVSTVLEGSVRAAGSRIRVTAQLIEADSGFHLWSANFDRDLIDIITLQEEIAGGIASALRGRLNPRKPRTADAEVYGFVMRARSLIDRGSLPNLLKAVELLEEAVRRDPDYADARVALSRALTYCCSRGAMQPEGYVAAKEQARLACEIDPSDAGAQALYGCGSARTGDWATGARHLQRAIDLYGTDPDLHSVYGGGFLLFAGHSKRAEYHTRRALALAPASAMAHVACAGIVQFNGDYAGGAALLDAAVELGYPEAMQPIPTLRAADARWRGEFAEAARLDVGAWRELIGDSGVRAVQLVYAAVDDDRHRAAATSALRALIARAEAEQWTPRYMGLSAHLLQWARLLDQRSLVHAAADLVVSGWVRTGIVDIGAFVSLYGTDHGHWRQDPYLETAFERVGLRAYWDIFGPPDG